MGLGVAGKGFQIDFPDEDLSFISPSCNYSILVDMDIVDFHVASTLLDVTGLKDKAEPFPLAQLLLTRTFWDLINVSYLALIRRQLLVC